MECDFFNDYCDDYDEYDEFPNHYTNPSSSYLIEDCFKLSINDIGKKSLYGKNGKIELTRCNYNDKLHCNFTSAHQSLNIRYTINKQVYIQNINFETESIRYGLRPYMQCKCGHRSNTLYLRPDMPYRFACRRCNNLKYELTTINPKTKIGKYKIYLLHLRKLDEAKIKINRLYYRGKVKTGAKSIAKKYLQWVLLYNPNALSEQEKAIILTLASN